MRALALLVVLASLNPPHQADAFGTVSIAGQNREHERITRQALDCAIAAALPNCFQPKSTDEIAGKSGTFGAVGAPDNPFRGLLMNSSAHCDNGDFLPVPGYPTSPHNPATALTACRNFMAQHMAAAVRAAARLILPNGSIDDSQIPTVISCTYLGTSGRAKCDVLEELGLVLHAAQDFYAHSNWTDEHVAAPTVHNPDGLARLGRSSFIDLRTPGPALPPGLITGCFVFKPESMYCNDPPTGRVKHADLNKDEGTIPGFVARTPRGRQGRNFERAVRAAIDDTQDKWLTLQENLRATYGVAMATLMICAITHDDPAATCGATHQRRAFPFFGIVLVAALLGALGGLGYLARSLRRPIPA